MSFEVQDQTEAKPDPRQVTVKARTKSDNQSSFFIHLMTTMALILIAVLAFFTPGTGHAQESSISIGGDTYAAGQSPVVGGVIENDVFAAGNSVTITANSGGDVHLAGNSITLSGATKGNVYVVGNTLTLSGAVGADLSAAGNQINVSGSNVSGNVRVGGNNVEITSAVGGSVVVGAESLTLNSSVSGDLEFSGNQIEFGPDAVVAGQVFLRSDKELEVPTRVASADRVTMEIVENQNMGDVARQVGEETQRSVFGAFLGSFVFYIFMFLIGFVWLALMPKRSEASFNAFSAKPWRSLLAGFFSLAAAIGLTIVLAMTLIGIVLIPFSVLLAILAWFGGLVAGAYFITRKLGGAFGQSADSLGMKVVLLAIGLGFVWVLGLVPFIGWWLTLVLVLLGLGGMTMARFYGAPKQSENT